MESPGSEKNLLFTPPGPAPQPTGDDEAAALWTARLDASVPVRTGEQIELAVDFANAHFFDPSTTEAIPTDATADRSAPAGTAPAAA